MSAASIELECPLCWIETHADKPARINASKYRYPSIAYPGGKSKVAKKIIAEMPPHSVYVEPFAGAAHVFFHKIKVDKNVLNDLNRELIGFFKDVKNKKICCDTSASKKRFERIKNKRNKTVCDYVYLNKNAYGGKGTFEGNPSYGHLEVKNPAGKKFCIDGYRLDKVKLTTKDFKESIRENDSKDTLFYVDPPYVKANKKECLYGKGKCSVSPEEVAKSLRKIKGKAIISYDDHPDVRKAFKGFNISKITLPYTFAKEKGKIKGKKQELLIKNY